MIKKSGDWSSFLLRSNSKLLIAFVLMTLAVAPIGEALPIAQAQTGVSFANIIRATVYLASQFDVPGGQATSCAGSGTIVSPDGLILTNAHNVVNGLQCKVDAIVVSLSMRPNDPPEPKYYAEVEIYDLRLDLAVLRITRQIDGRIIEPGSLSLPFVELGDSLTLRLDDTVVVFGYRDLGDDALTLSRGTIIGFIAEPLGGERAWLKTSATVVGTMSGGGVYNAQGRLIGIPTAAPSLAPGAVLDCRRVQDTTGDGIVDSQDGCIPIVGFINSLRPAHLARGMIRAAQLGIRYMGHVATPVVEAAQEAVTGGPEVGAIHFSPAVNEAGQPTTFVTQLPAGANSLYLFFDYRNMRPGVVYELRATRNGDSQSTFSQSPALWGGQTNGLWYIGSAGQAWQNGVYEFTLLIEGRAVQTAQITIGGSPAASPSFSDVSFGLLDLQGNDIQVGYVLGVGDIIAARFIFRDMPDGLPWTAIWYYEGMELRRDEATWNQGVSGAATVNIRPQSGGFVPGRYRLELWAGDRLSALGDLILAGGQEGVFARIFQNLRFSSDIQAGEPGGIVASSFANRPAGLYAFIDWQLIGAGTPWTYRWLVDGEAFFERTEQWAAPESGANFWSRLGSSLLLPDGSYTYEILIGGQLFVTGSARVGMGQLPVTAGSRATGVRVSGEVLDAATQEGIPGALVIVLEAQYSVVDFVWDAAQILAMSVTDSQGRFEFDRLLPYGEFYSMIVIGERYLPLTADGIELNLADPELEDGQLEFRLELNRDLVP